MRELIYVRPVRRDDADAFTAWSLSTTGNLFDPDVAKYPTTTVLAAYNHKGPVLYAPLQRPLMIESLAIRPDADVADVATALKEITQAAVSKAHEEGRGEVYFLCKDKSTIEIAKRHAYTEMPWRLFRIKLKDLETTHEAQEQVRA